MGVAVAEIRALVEDGDSVGELDVKEDASIEMTVVCVDD